MDRIICLVGESGSGKSTIAEELSKKDYNYIQSYTTRKQRYEGEKGHIFVDYEMYIESTITVEDKANIIAYTYFDGNHYWASREQYRNRGNSIYIVDPVGVRELKEEVKDAEIITIYLNADEQIRYNRMCKRKYGEENIYDEAIYSRIKHDKKAFKIIQCDYVVDSNRSLEEVLSDIENIIGYMNKK
jgi:guanylate kinase